MTKDKDDDLTAEDIARVYDVPVEMVDPELAVFATSPLSLDERAHYIARLLASSDEMTPDEALYLAMWGAGVVSADTGVPKGDRNGSPWKRPFRRLRRRFRAALLWGADHLEG